MYAEGWVQGVSVPTHLPATTVLSWSGCKGSCRAAPVFLQLWLYRVPAGDSGSSSTGFSFQCWLGPGAGRRNLCTAAAVPGWCRHNAGKGSYKATSDLLLPCAAGWSCGKNWAQVGTMAAVCRFLLPPPAAADTGAGGEPDREQALEGWNHALLLSLAKPGLLHSLCPWPLARVGQIQNSLCVPSWPQGHNAVLNYCFLRNTPGLYTSFILIKFFWILAWLSYPKSYCHLPILSNVLII